MKFTKVGLIQNEDGSHTVTLTEMGEEEQKGTLYDRIKNDPKCATLKASLPAGLFGKPSATTARPKSKRTPQQRQAIARSVRDHVLALIQAGDGRMLHGSLAWQTAEWSAIYTTPVSEFWRKERLDEDTEKPCYILDVWCGNKVMSIRWDDPSAEFEITTLKPGDWPDVVLNVASGRLNTTLGTIAAGGGKIIKAGQEVRLSGQQTGKFDYGMFDLADGASKTRH